MLSNLRCQLRELLIFENSEILFWPSNLISIALFNSSDFKADCLMMLVIYLSAVAWYITSVFNYISFASVS